MAKAAPRRMSSPKMGAHKPPEHKPGEHMTDRHTNNASIMKKPKGGHGKVVK